MRRPQRREHRAAIRGEARRPHPVAEPRPRDPAQHLGAVRTVAEPGRLEIEPRRRQPLQHRDPVERALHRIGAADVADPQPLAQRARLLGRQRRRRDMIAPRQVDVVDQHALAAAVRRIGLEGLAAVEQAERCAAHDGALQRRHRAVGQPGAQARAPASLPDAAPGDLGFDAVGPDREGTPHPVRLPAGDGAPVAEQPADGEGEIIRPVDQPPDLRQRGGQRPREAVGPPGLGQQRELDALQRRADAVERHVVARRDRPALRRQHDQPREVLGPEPQAVAGLRLEQRRFRRAVQRHRHIEQQRAGDAPGRRRGHRAPRAAATAAGSSALRAAAIRSATRSAFAAMVRLGFTPFEVGMNDESAT